jgi:hypothetical protein
MYWIARSRADPVHVKINSCRRLAKQGDDRGSTTANRSYFTGPRWGRRRVGACHRPSFSVRDIHGIVNNIPYRKKKTRQTTPRSHVNSLDTCAGSTCAARCLDCSPGRRAVPSRGHQAATREGVEGKALTRLRLRPTRRVFRQNFVQSFRGSAAGREPGICNHGSGNMGSGLSASPRRPGMMRLTKVDTLAPKVLT